jgi:hypothetical protein
MLAARFICREIHLLLPYLLQFSKSVSGRWTYQLWFYRSAAKISLPLFTIKMTATMMPETTPAGISFHKGSSRIYLQQYRAIMNTHRPDVSLTKPEKVGVTFLTPIEIRTQQSQISVTKNIPQGESPFLARRLAGLFLRSGVF